MDEIQEHNYSTEKNDNNDTFLFINEENKKENQIPIENSFYKTNEENYNFEERDKKTNEDQKKTIEEQKKRRGGEKG